MAEKDWRLRGDYSDVSDAGARAYDAAMWANLQRIERLHYHEMTGRVWCGGCNADGPDGSSWEQLTHDADCAWMALEARHWAVQGQEVAP